METQKLNSYAFVDQIKSDRKGTRWIHFRMFAVIKTLLPTALLAGQPGIKDRFQTSPFHRVRTGFVAHTFLWSTGYQQYFFFQIYV